MIRILCGDVKCGQVWEGRKEERAVFEDLRSISNSESLKAEGKKDTLAVTQALLMLVVDGCLKDLRERV